MSNKKIPIGLQLYSVRNECEKDLPAVLQQVAAMGYQAVEFAGYYGRSAVEMRKLIDDNGLLCCGAHTGLDTLSDANFSATVDYHKILGNRFLIVPWIAPDRFSSAAACKDIAAQLTDLARKAKPHGMFVGYHAHNGDFKKIDGQTAWDLLFTSAGPDVIMQMDVGNCLDGGGDPYAALKKFPGRSRTVHLKEFGGKPHASVGEGDVNWLEVFRICESTGGTEWYVVEQENTPSPIESVRACLNNLRKMGK